MSLFKLSHSTRGVTDAVTLAAVALPLYILIRKIQTGEEQDEGGLAIV